MKIEQVVRSKPPSISLPLHIVYVIYPARGARGLKGKNVEFYKC